MEGVVRLGDALIGPGRGGVDLSGTFHFERLVGPFGIELVDEAIELGLLLKEVGAGGTGGLLLEGEVHALMAAVPLRVAWVNAVDADAQAQPPDGELGEMKQATAGGEGHAVVGADGAGQAAFLKEALKGSEGGLFGVGLHGLAEQEKTGGVVGDGERVTVAFVGKHELTLVISAPEIIGAETLGKRGTGGAGSAADGVSDEAVAIEDGVDGTAGGDLHGMRQSP